MKRLSTLNIPFYFPSNLSSQLLTNNSTQVPPLTVIKAEIAKKFGDQDFEDITQQKRKLKVGRLIQMSQVAIQRASSSMAVSPQKSQNKVGEHYYNKQKSSLSGFAAVKKSQSQVSDYHSHHGIKKKALDVEYGQMAQQIKEHKERVANLNQEDKLKVEIDVLNNVLQAHYSKMEEQREKQVGILNEKIQKFESALVRKKPKISFEKGDPKKASSSTHVQTPLTTDTRLPPDPISNKARRKSIIAAATPNIHDHDFFQQPLPAADEEVQFNGNRQYFQEAIKDINMSSIINHFNLEHAMRKKLISKNLVKLNPSDLTYTEKEQLKEAKREKFQLQQNVKISTELLSKFQDKLEDEHKLVQNNQNIYLVMQLCNENSAFSRFKNREMRLQDAQNNKENFSKKSNPAKQSQQKLEVTGATNQEQGKNDETQQEAPQKFQRKSLLAETSYVFDREEIFKLTENLEREEQEKQARKIAKFKSFQQEKEAYLNSRLNKLKISEAKREMKMSQQSLGNSSIKNSKLREAKHSSLERDYPKRIHVGSEIDLISESKDQIQQQQSATRIPLAFYNQQQLHVPFLNDISLASRLKSNSQMDVTKSTMRFSKGEITPGFFIPKGSEYTDHASPMNRTKSKWQPKIPVTQLMKYAHHYIKRQSEEEDYSELASESSPKYSAEIQRRASQIGIFKYFYEEILKMQLYFNKFPQNHSIKPLVGNSFNCYHKNQTEHYSKGWYKQFANYYEQNNSLCFNHEQRVNSRQIHQQLNV